VATTSASAALAMGERERLSERARSSARSNPGWSLLECLGGLAVAGGVCVAVAPSVSAALAGVRLRAGAGPVGAALGRVRAGALAEGRAFEFRVAGPAAFAVGPVGASSAHEQLPRGVVFGTVTSGGVIRVSASGVAENATVTLSTAGRERHVILN